MDYSNMDDVNQPQNVYQLRQLVSQQWENINIQSDLLLSHIQYQQMHNQSPQINISTAEAKIKELAKTAEPNPLRKSKPYCGCGQYYSCTSSLYLHIRSKHGGIPPKDTIGGPKGIVKKNYQNVQDPLVKLQDNQGNGYQSQPKPRFVREGEAQSHRGNQGGSDANSSDSKGRQREENGIKVCRICGKTYSCNSSLNLHLKRKHQQKRRDDGLIEYEARVEDKQPRSYECSICGLSYGSKSALGLHYNNKHNARNGNLQLPYDEDRIQKCGCGLIYQSRSALNMHVKKKHDGLYPQGTSDKPNLRSKGRTSENFVAEGEDRQSIYDSQSNQNANIQQPKIPNRQIQSERIYRCGCGRNYSCSSSLNLHIKKNHNWVVPKGTIGGPRGMRNQEQKIANQKKEQEIQIQQNTSLCDECKSSLKDCSYFQCETCQSHILCSLCFWKGDNFDNEDHRWQLFQKTK